MTREENIKWLESLKKEIGKSEHRALWHYAEAIDMAIEALQTEPKTGGEWIPCSERLPEEFNVLCCDNHGEMLIAHPFECDDSDTGFSAGSGECYMYNCVAWMPLPKPYKESEINHEG